MKRLVLCCDGTWNTPRNETNVFRTYRFLRERLGSPAEVTQKDGVRSCGGRAADGSQARVVRRHKHADTLPIFP